MNIEEMQQKYEGVIFDALISERGVQSREITMLIKKLAHAHIHGRLPTDMHNMIDDWLNSADGV